MATMMQTPTRSMLPCRTCPWRIDQVAASIPNYNHGKACNLTVTVGEVDGFRPVMACHASTEGDPYACNGYLARAGDTNLNVRILAALGQVPWPSQVEAAVDAVGIELHPTYADVLTKLGGDAK